MTIVNNFLKLQLFFFNTEKTVRMETQGLVDGGPTNEGEQGFYKKNILSKTLR